MKFCYPVAVTRDSFNLLEKQMQRYFELAHQSHSILIHEKTREKALLTAYPFEQKFVSTMVFQTKYSPGLTLPDHTTPVESDFESITSTIPTKIQLKRSKNDPVRPVNNNDGYYLVSSSKTQPKIKPDTTAPPLPSRYPHVVIPKDPPGYYNQEGTAPSAFKLPVKIVVYQPQQPTNAPNDDAKKEEVPIPTDTLANDPDTTNTLEWTKVMRERPMVESIPKYTRYSNNNEYAHDNDDANDDELIPIPRDMFEMDPTPPVEQPIPSVMRIVEIKVQPTKPSPTRVSNKYVVFTSDNNEDDNNENDFVSTTGDVQRAPATGNTVQHMITQAMTSTRGNDAGEDDAGVHLVTVTNLPTTDTMNAVHTALDLGSLANNNKNKPDFDMFDDDVSQVTVATKNLAEGNPNAPIEIPHDLSDSDDKQFVQIPNISTKPKKSHKNKNKNKNKSTRTKKVGKQATGSNEATGSSKRGHEGDPPDKSTLSDNSSTGGNNNSNAHQRSDMNDQSNQ